MSKGPTNRHSNDRHVFNTALKGLGRKIVRPLRNFRRREDGSVMIFSLLVFLLMIAVCGMAVDIARFEHKRAKLQTTLDRAVLAAASLSQTLDPETVALDYFAKAGLGTLGEDYLVDVTVSQGLTYRRVSIEASAQDPLLFLGYIQFCTSDCLYKTQSRKFFTATASGAAEERIPKVEVSMVLDISGSMRGSKLSDMKVAAKQFVTTLLDTSDKDLISISLVPYAEHVNAGPDIMSQFNTTGEHRDSHCVRFETGEYNHTSLWDNSIDNQLSTDLTLVGNYDYSRNSGSSLNTNCPPASRSIVAAQGDADALHDRIDDLTAGGTTSMDLGMKWGVALLDPDSNNLIRHLVTDSLVAAEYQVDAAFDERPFEYSDTDALKVVVIMTDGQNTTRYDIKDQFKSGNSDLWQNNSGGDTYVYHNRSRTNRDYYRINKRKWYSGASGTPLTWPEVWNKYGISYHRNRFHRRTGGFKSWGWRNVEEVAAYSSTINSNLDDICSAAKEKGIVVFSIGFEAPSSGQAVMENCASSSSHYFDVDGTEISEAFSAIAATIQKLRLTH